MTGAHRRHHLKASPCLSRPGVKNKCFRKYVFSCANSSGRDAVIFILKSPVLSPVIKEYFQLYFNESILYVGSPMMRVSMWLKSKLISLLLRKYLTVLIILTRCTDPAKNARRICFLMILNSFSGKIRVWMIQVSVVTNIYFGTNTNIEYIRKLKMDRIRISNIFVKLKIFERIFEYPIYSNIRIIKHKFVNKLVPHFSFNTFTQIWEEMWEEKQKVNLLLKIKHRYH